MKKFLITILLALSVFVPCSAAKIEPGATVAVMDFGTHPGAVPIDIDIFNAGKAVCEYLINSLISSGKLTIMDRTMVEDKIKAANLNVTGIIDPETAQKLGQILGVKYIIYGNVNDVTISEISGSIAGTNVSVCTVASNLILRLMNVETGEIVAVAKGGGKSKSGKGSTLVLQIGNVKITQDSVHNSLQKAALSTVENLLVKLYGEPKK